MSKDMTERATRIYNDIDNDAYGSTQGVHDMCVRTRSISKISQALTQVRQEALEEAAQIAVMIKADTDPEIDDIRAKAAEDIFNAIRTMKGEGEVSHEQNR